ncbi:hypothetical protein C9374_004557 [Naegleria lovaniensis]|uniref:Uncharacterized protein n=1 Tax=Naegleria lovaniensis TaxID=51637 RepID=A0AA88GSD3_NAELO|nr:uncharacterized protein C9374_004557 [Naegleria lovaniensis]KAG2383220.1 hypothetical protein C9374_004557 [Naegleria lovaniensis]
MPHMIDKDIMNELQKKWEYEFNVTSSNRFRSSNDMQYTFTYFYYLMHEGIPYNATEFFKEHVDTNQDDTMDDYEIRNLANVMLNKYKISQEKVNELSRNVTKKMNDLKKSETMNDLKKSETINDLKKTNDETTRTEMKDSKVESTSNPTSTTTTSSKLNHTLSNSTSPFGSSYFSSWRPRSSSYGSWGSYDTYSSFKDYLKAVRSVLFGHLNYTNLVMSQYDPNYKARTRPTFEDFVNSGLSDVVKTKVHKSEQRFSYTLEDLSEVGFHMIRDDYDKVGEQLDELTRKRPKFICLNDDMNQTTPNIQVVELLHNFYRWYFPKPSQFELPEGEENPFLYIDQLQQYHDMQRYSKYAYDGVIVTAICFICCCGLILQRCIVSRMNKKSSSGRSTPQQQQHSGVVSFTSSATSTDHQLPSQQQGSLHTTSHKSHPYGENEEV